MQLHEAAPRDNIAGVHVRDAGAGRRPAHRRRHADLLGSNRRGRVVQRHQVTVCAAAFFALSWLLSSCALGMAEPSLLTHIRYDIHLKD